VPQRDDTAAGGVWHDTSAPAPLTARQVRELQALVAPKPPQGVLVRGHAGRVIDKLSPSQEDAPLSTASVEMDRSVATCHRSLLSSQHDAPCGAAAAYRSRERRTGKNNHYTLNTAPYTMNPEL